MERSNKDVVLVGDNDRNKSSSNRRGGGGGKKKIKRGDRVEAKVKGWTKYYGGEVTRVNDDGTYDIKFDDGERKRGVKKSQIKGGEDEDDDESDFDDRSSSRKCTRCGDRVEAKVNGWTKYITVVK